jgi:hypothetical protein
MDLISKRKEVIANAKILIPDGGGVWLALMVSGASALEVGGYTVKSDKAFRYRVTLGAEKDAKAMDLVLDESKGTGKGYDVAIVDTNLDGKLSDEKPIKRDERMKTNDYSRFMFEVTAPFGQVDPKAKYNFSAYVFPNARTTSYGQDERMAASNLMCTLSFAQKDEKWSYMLLGLKGKADEKKDPGLKLVRLGTPFKLDLKAEVKEGQLEVAGAIKDTEEQTLRVARRGETEVVPHLKVTGPDGQVFVDKDLSYG